MPPDQAHTVATQFGDVAGGFDFDANLSPVHYTSESYTRDTGEEYFLRHYHDWKRRTRLKLGELRPGVLFYVILAWAPVIVLLWLIHK